MLADVGHGLDASGVEVSGLLDPSQLKLALRFKTGKSPGGSRGDARRYRGVFSSVVWKEFEKSANENQVAGGIADD